MLRKQGAGKEILRGIEKYLEGRTLRDETGDDEDLPELEGVEEETQKDKKKGDERSVKTEEELPDFDDIEEEQQGKTEEVVEEKTEEKTNEEAKIEDVDSEEEQMREILKLGDELEEKC